MKIFLAGNWLNKPKKLEVKNPFDNSMVDTVPRADAGDLETALAFAERSAKVMQWRPEFSPRTSNGR
jgi:glyceraldehyde-3-phosphate dehydrogenase (NADP+)